MTGPTRMHRGIVVLVPALCGLLLAGCSAIGLGGPDIADLSGTYSGEVDVEGQAIDGTLELTQEGTALTATFDAPMAGVRAEGDGTVAEDDTFRMELSYDVQCPGTAVLRGSVDRETGRLSGRIEATDCTGTVGGRFSFRPR